jgi:hypothetical protein
MLRLLLPLPPPPAASAPCSASDAAAAGLPQARRLLLHLLLHRRARGLSCCSRKLCMRGNTSFSTLRPIRMSKWPAEQHWQHVSKATQAAYCRLWQTRCKLCKHLISVCQLAIQVSQWPAEHAANNDVANATRRSNQS